MYNTQLVAAHVHPLYSENASAAVPAGAYVVFGAENRLDPCSPSIGSSGEAAGEAPAFCRRCPGEQEWIIQNCSSCQRQIRSPALAHIRHHDVFFGCLVRLPISPLEHGVSSPVASVVKHQVLLFQ